jgi:hypothetical protein
LVCSCYRIFLSLPTQCAGCFGLLAAWGIEDHEAAENGGGDLGGRCRTRASLVRLCADVAWLFPPPLVHLFPLLLCTFRQELSTHDMHRIFLVKELVSAVLHFLKQDCEGSLAAVACSCRALSDMALDELWAKAEFWDLAKTMRADLWEVTHERRMPLGDWDLNGTQDVYTLVSGGLTDDGPLIIALAETGWSRQP